MAAAQSALTSVLKYKRKMPGYEPRDKTMELKGIEPLFPDLTFPEKGVTYFYGGRNAGLRYAMGIEAADDENLAMIDFRVNVGNWIRQKVGLDEEASVANTGVLNFAAAKRDITDIALDVANEAIKPDDMIYDGWPKRGTAFPYLAGLLHQRPEFSHLKVIIYQVFHPETGDFQVATVFTPEAIQLDTIKAGDLATVKFLRPSLAAKLED